MQRREHEVPDEGLIHAWLDGELEADEAARVERLVAEDAAWAAAAAEARGVIAASSRILGHLDVVAGDVIPRGGSAAPDQGSDAGAAVARAGESRVPKPSVVPRRVVPTWMRVAAGLVLVAGVAYLGRDAREMAVAPEVVATNEPERADAEVAEPMAAVSAISAPPAPPPAAAKLAAVDSAAGRRGAVPERILDSPNAISMVSADAAPAAVAKQSAATAPARAEAITLDATTRVPSRVMGGDAARVLGATMLLGCWGTVPTEGIAAVQRDLRIVRTAGDTLVLALQPGGAEAQVLRIHEDSLRGAWLDARGRRVPFAAVRVTCTP